MPKSAIFLSLAVGIARWIEPAGGFSRLMRCCSGTRRNGEVRRRSASYEE